MASRPKVKFPIRKTQYQALVTYANNIVAQMTTNIANFPVPSPALPLITAASSDCQTKIGLWGVVGARGSHNDLLNLRASANALYNLLVAEFNYVQNIVDPTTSYADQDAFITSSGFSTKNSPTPQGVLAQPENFHQMFSPGVSIYTPKLKWKKPLGVTSPNNVKLYKLYRRTGTALPAVIATTTKTSFIDTTAVANTSYSYAASAVNTAGEGPFCPFILINVPL